MRNRLTRWTVVLSAISLTAAGLITIADAHIGVSHSPFTTDGPDLRSVSIDGNHVDFCFDEDVAGPQPLNEARFGLRGYNSGTVAVGDDADLDTSDAKCVEVDFDDARAIEDFTIGVVLSTAVQDAQGAQNITASASLGESEVEGGPGITDAPNLQRSFKIDSIEFSLDENMNCGAMGASAFGYYKEGGSSSVQYGSDVGDCDGNEAVIEFGAPVEDIARVFIDPTNGNEPCAPAPSGACAGFEAEGDDTEDPDLERAERDDETVTFKFDEDVTGTPDEDMFQVAAEDGTKFAPEAGSCDLAGDDEVECDFPAIEDATEGDIVLAGVGSCAITADEDSECSTIGDASIDDSGHAPGFSDGPDLETCDIDEEASTATFAFDEPVRSTSADEEGFEVFDTHGTMVDATHIGNASGSSVTVEFASGGITGAIGCHVAFDAVDDLLSNQSPESSVGVAPTTQSTTSSITTPPPPRVIPVASTVSMHYANASKRFVGSVASSRSRCRSGRKVTVKKQRSGADTSVGSTTTDGKGHFELLSRGASGRYYAVAKEKSFGVGSDHIICRRDKSPTVGAGRSG